MLFILVQATITLNLAQNATRRGKYIKPFRNQAIEEIRRLIVQEGYTRLETMNMLKILPERFARTCMKPLHQKDKYLLQS